MRKLLVYALAAASAWSAASAADAATAARARADALKDGTPVETIILSNTHGVSARILSYGATLQSLLVPDRNGKAADIVLGFDTAAEYEATQAYFGATVGRYANRIAKGRFTLDGVSYQQIGPINRQAIEQLNARTSVRRSSLATPGSARGRRRILRRQRRKSPRRSPEAGSSSW
jgi:Aldose 1-epimerase